MPNNSLTDYASIAQIVLPVITLIGIIVSMWLSVKALREVQIDRKYRQIPHLAFEPGGGKYPIEFIKSGSAILGIDSDYTLETFKGIPNDAESICLKTDHGKIVIWYGKLRNYGSGPALSTRVGWIPQKVQIGSEIFRISEEKLLEPQYSRGFNSIPASPSHILPSEAANFFRLPTFIQKDFEKKITIVEGILEIECEDIFGGKHVVHQDFYIRTDYESEKPSILMTFGELRSIDSLKVPRA
jgi:hypothetical protein